MHWNTKTIILFFSLFLNIEMIGQVAINTDESDPDASAMLEVKSTAKGILIPRMTTTQRNAVSSPANGLMIYNTTTNSFNYHNGTAWSDLDVQALSLSGNTLNISNGAGVDLSQFSDADNLGNHTATQNIQLTNNWLTNGGNDNGLKIDDIGAVSLNSTSARTIRSQSTTSLAANYMELNNNSGTRALFGADGNGLSGGDTSNVVVANWSNGGLNFFTNAAERMSISNTGNVGIGQTTPTFKLHVNGTLKAVGAITTDTTITANGLITAITGGDAIKVTAANGTTNVMIREEYANAGAISMYNTSGAERMVQFIDTANDAAAIFGYGPSSTNLIMGNLLGHNNNGFIAVGNNTSSPTAGMYIDAAGNGIIYGTTKNFRMNHPNDKTKEIWYASLEGPEAAAYVRGTAQLVNGKAVIPFPEHFALVANPATLTVTITPNSGSSKGLAVVKKTTEGFEIQELSNGTGTYTFDWVAMGVRKGQEDYKVVRKKKDLIKKRSTNNSQNTTPKQTLKKIKLPVEICPEHFK